MENVQQQLFGNRFLLNFNIENSASFTTGVCCARARCCFPLPTQIVSSILLNGSRQPFSKQSRLSSRFFLNFIAESSACLTSVRFYFPHIWQSENELSTLSTRPLRTFGQSTLPRPLPQSPARNQATSAMLRQALQ